MLDVMISPRWTYSNPRGLTIWYGHVDYYGQYVIGQWFALDADTGAEYWSHGFRRPNTVLDCVRDVIVATEMRSDGPWITCFGIYAIAARTGELLWANHGRGRWGRLLRWLDRVPNFTNEFRDSPLCVVDPYVLTEHGRTLDLLTGQECSSADIKVPANCEREDPEEDWLRNKKLEIDGETIVVEGTGTGLVIRRRDKNGADVWRFAARDHRVHADIYYRRCHFHGRYIFLILADTQDCAPIDETKPLHLQPDPADYRLGILDMSSGECRLCPLVNATQRKECRIEAIRDSGLLVSCDRTDLTEYEIEG